MDLSLALWTSASTFYTVHVCFVVYLRLSNTAVPMHGCLPVCQAAGLTTCLLASLSADSMPICQSSCPST